MLAREGRCHAHESGNDRVTKFQAGWGARL